MQETLDKGLIKHLGKHILKHHKGHNLAIISCQTHQLHKWLKNVDIDKILSNDLWTNLVVMDKPKICLKKTQCHHGYFRAHVVPKDVVVLPSLNPIYYVSLGTRMTTIHQ